jgi:hypothetical protein
VLSRDTIIVTSGLVARCEFVLCMSFKNSDLTVCSREGADRDTRLPAELVGYSRIYGYVLGIKVCHKYVYLELGCW